MKAYTGFWCQISDDSNLSASNLSDMVRLDQVFEVGHLSKVTVGTDQWKGGLLCQRQQPSG